MSIVQAEWGTVNGPCRREGWDSPSNLYIILSIATRNNANKELVLHRCIEDKISHMAKNLADLKMQAESNDAIDKFFRALYGVLTVMPKGLRLAKLD